jgi:S-DNA-T family DNA segregation ATPase FtsK/SpoIIIE
MLYMSSGGRITRVHGPFVSDNDVENVVAFLREKYQHWPQEDLLKNEALDAFEEDNESGSGASSGEDGQEDLYAQAVELVIRDNRPAASYLQRRFPIGYNTAARLIERMEADGIVSPPNQAGKRTLITNRSA